MTDQAYSLAAAKSKDTPEEISYEHYDKYKDSGIEWIGEVPKEWRVCPLKFLGKLVNGSTPDTDPGNWDGDIWWVTPADLNKVNGGKISKTERTLTDRSSPVKVPGGSILVSTRAPVGYVAIASEETSFNQGCRAIIPASISFPRFLKFSLLAAVEEMQVYSQGTTFMEISTKPFAALKMPCPSFSEQKAIVTYLDQETAKIDNLIDSEQKMIGLLTEKRAALIFEAVTKGIDRSVSMKDSGIEWIGEVPEEWNITVLKRLAKTRSGNGFPEKYQGRVDEAIPFHKVNVLSKADAKGFIVTRDDTVSTQAMENFKARTFPARTVILAKIGAALLIGRIRMLAEESCIDNNLLGVNVKKNCFDRFLFYAMHIIDFSFLVNPGPVPSISDKNLKYYPIAIPPLKEQETIATYLDQETTKIDAMIEKLSKMISLQQERRAALIFEAVTGKIKVPGV